MRPLLIALLLVFTSGCSTLEQPEVQRCEEQLLGKLKAPSSYKRINVRVTDINPKDPSDLVHVSERWVTIEYDAVNSFNAPLRDTEICRYPLKNGQADLWNTAGDLPIADEDMTGPLNAVDPVENVVTLPRPDDRRTEEEPVYGDDGGIDADNISGNISYD